MEGPCEARRIGVSPPFFCLAMILLPILGHNSFQTYLALASDSEKDSHVFCFLVGQ